MSEKKRILIIEDEIEMVKLLRMRLEANGYDVLVAGDGQEGLDMAKREKPDLIILDLMLPKMDGFKVCGLIKSDTKYSHVPIIILSARGHESDVATCKELGAEVYITKPFEPRELLAKINSLLKT